MPAERASIRRFWKDYGVSYVNLEWYRLFKALNGSVDPRFIPEEIFRTRLEPLLCRRDVSAAYHDKNQMDRIFADLPRPRTILRNIYGAYFDEGYQPIRRDAVAAHLADHHGPHFLKPAISGTGSGNNVARVEFVDGEFRLGASTLSLAEIERIYVQDFVIQEAVSQHASLALFHPGSLNTLRVITLRLNDTLRLIAATLRMGNGSHVDNGHAGGLLCGVNIETGALSGFACDVQFRKLRSPSAHRRGFCRELRVVRQDQRAGARGACAAAVFRRAVVRHRDSRRWRALPGGSEHLRPGRRAAPVSEGRAAV